MWLNLTTRRISVYIGILRKYYHTYPHYYKWIDNRRHKRGSRKHYHPRVLCKVLQTQPTNKLSHVNFSITVNIAKLENCLYLKLDFQYLISIKITLRLSQSVWFSIYNILEIPPIETVYGDHHNWVWRENKNKLGWAGVWGRLHSVKIKIWTFVGRKGNSFLNWKFPFSLSDLFW